MGKKRKSRGRSKGGKGRGKMVQCAGCGGLVPRDKAKQVTRWVSLVDRRMVEELKKRGAYLPRTRITKYYCISCSVHRHITSPRKREDRKREEQRHEEERLKRMTEITIKGKVEY